MMEKGVNFTVTLKVIYHISSAYLVSGITQDYIQKRINIFCEKDFRKYKKFLKKMETVLKKIFINTTLKHFMYI
jgi:hypothetical protein